MSIFSKVVMGAAVVGVAAVASKVGVAGVALAGVAAKAMYDYGMAGSKAQASKEWANKVEVKAEEAKVVVEEVKAVVEEAPVVMKNRIRNRLRMTPARKEETIQEKIDRLQGQHPGMEFALIHARSRKITMLEEMEDKVVIKYMTNEHCGEEEEIVMEVFHTGEYHMYDSFDYNMGGDEKIYN